MKYHETLYEALAKQYEAAKLDEAKAGALVQVIDAADIPERKSWPPRTLLVLSITILAVLVYCFAILLIHTSGEISSTKQLTSPRTKCLS